MYESLRTKPRYLKIILNFSPKVSCPGGPLERASGWAGDREGISSYCLAEQWDACGSTGFPHLRGWWIKSKENLPHWRVWAHERPQNSKTSIQIHWEQKTEVKAVNSLTGTFNTTVSQAVLFLFGHEFVKNFAQLAKNNRKLLYCKPKEDSKWFSLYFSRFPSHYDVHGTPASSHTRMLFVLFLLSKLASCWGRCGPSQAVALSDSSSLRPGEAWRLQLGLGWNQVELHCRCLQPDTLGLAWGQDSGRFFYCCCCCSQSWISVWGSWYYCEQAVWETCVYPEVQVADSHGEAKYCLILKTIRINLKKRSNLGDISK